MSEPLTLALPKGRIQADALALFAAAGFDLSATQSDSRRLVHDCGPFRVLVVRASDVPSYVAYGAADVGVAGRDTLLEEGFDLYEPLDLEIGACRMAVAEPKARPVDTSRELHLRVATKYPRITARYLQEECIVADIIKLSGAIELAPLTGLADRIVDLVSTGATLRDNGLVEVATLMHVTSRLVVNRASLKLRSDAVGDLTRRLRAAVVAART